MSKIGIPRNAVVFIGDGRKALFLRNHGDEKFPNLRTERVFVDINPATHDQGTERPGRSFSSVGPGRSAVESTDWHHLEQHKFVRAVSAALEKLVRHDLHGDVKARLIAEVGKDLTKHPLYEIEKHLVE
jgi:protein required for attachment to host cells